jgi:T5SS/PEP-CTERM-associated repeat protein
MPHPLPAFCCQIHQRHASLVQPGSAAARRSGLGLPRRRLCVALALALGTGLLAQPAAAAELTWSGQFGSPRWSASIFGFSNWDGGGVPQNGDALVFAGNTGLVNDNDYVGLSVSGLSFAAGAGAFTLQGLVNTGTYRLAVTGDLSNHSSNAQTINLLIDARGTGPQLWDGGTHGMAINRPVTVGDGATVTLANRLNIFNGNFFTLGGAQVPGDTVLNITSGSTMFSQGGLIARDLGSHGLVKVSGAQSSWGTSSFGLQVGHSGNGQLTIEDGGRVTSHYGDLGGEVSGTGTGNVTGANSQWVVSREMTVGVRGLGLLTIADGGLVSNGMGRVGMGARGKVTVTGANSRWVNSSELSVGVSGGNHGELQIDGGGQVVSAQGVVGLGSTGTVRVAGAGSRWDSAGNIAIGNGQIGYLTVTAGGTVASGSGAVGNNALGSGVVVLSGAGASWVNAGTLDVGRAGEGTLDIYGGATVAAHTLLIAGQGVLNLYGGTLQVNDASLQGAGQFNWTAGTLRFTKPGATLGAGAFKLDSTTTVQANQRLEFSHSFAVGSGHQLLLAGGTLGGTGSLLNDGTLAGFGAVAGSGGFINSSVLVHSGNLVLSNTGANTNTGNWDLAPGAALVLNGATLANHGSINLNSGTVSGTGTLVNAAGGTVFGRGSITAQFSNAGALLVDTGTTRVDPAFANSGQIQLTANAATLAGGGVSNSGQIEGRGRVANDVHNTGLLQALGGTLTFAGALVNTGSGVIAAGSGAKVLVLAGLARNDAHVQLDGGTYDNNGAPMLNATGGTISGFGTLRSGALVNDGRLWLAGSTSAVHADVLSHGGSQMVLTGQGQTAFYGAVDVQGGAELRVSQGAVATFFGLVQQRSGALFTGTGSKHYEGGLAVGNSPGLGADAGNVSFGVGNVYTAEIGGTKPGDAQGDGIEFDRYVVAGTLSFGGTLAVLAWDGFAPQAGQRFDLFDWGTSQGTFAALDFAQAPLAGGLVWDTSRLYIDGTLAVAAVPEPASTSLLLAGLGVLGWLARCEPSRGCFLTS